MDPPLANFTQENRGNQTLWESWTEWASLQYERASDVGESWLVWANAGGSSANGARKGLSWDGGLCFLLDTFIGSSGGPCLETHAQE